MVSVKSCVKLLIVSSLTGFAMTSSPMMIITELSVAYATVWGSITGTLSTQTDLQTSLDGKQAADADLTDLADGSLTGSLVGSGVAQSVVTNLTADLAARVLDTGDTMTGQLTVNSTVTFNGNGKSSGSFTATNIDPSPFFVVFITSTALSSGCTQWMGDAPSNSAITITSVVARTYSVAASSANYSLQEKTSQNANGSQIFNGTFSTGTWNHGNPITSFADATIAAGSSLYYVDKPVGNTAGTPRHLTVTVYYKYATP